MAGSSENLARLKRAYELWDKTKGTDTTMWTDLFADNVRFRSLAAGRPGVDFTMECRSASDVARYFAGLAADWTMNHYRTETFAVDGDRIVMSGTTSWTHKRTKRTVDTPKVDLVVFRDGRIVEFFELYDTEMILAAARP